MNCNCCITTYLPNNALFRLTIAYARRKLIAAHAFIYLLIKIYLYRVKHRQEITVLQCCPEIGSVNEQSLTFVALSVPCWWWNVLAETQCVLLAACAIRNTPNVRRLLLSHAAGVTGQE